MTAEGSIPIAARLNAGTSCRLTLVIVPSGLSSGSIRSADAVRRWAAELEEDVAWVALTPAHNEPARFLGALIGALGDLYPPVEELAAEIQPAPPSKSRASLDRGLTDLLNALLPLDRPALLILENYDAIDNPVIHDSLGWMLDYLPPRLRLVMINGSEPPIPNLARLRVRRQLVELRIEPQ